MKAKFLLLALLAQFCSLTAMAYDAYIEATAYDAYIDGLFYNFSGDEATVTHNNGNDYYGDVVIPESVIYNGCTYRVTSISYNAFRYCHLTSITIPNSVTSIAYNAFQYSHFYSIKVEEGNTNFDSRNDCNAIIETKTNTLIKGCENTVIPNGVTTISNYAFYCCFELKSITIPNSVTRIGSSAFEHCSDLTSVIIPNSVTSIGSSAFHGCWGLTSITIPNSVTGIGSSTFSGCSGLTSITIPNSVTDIGSSAFQDCTSLTSVTIPNSVTTIGESAFEGCTSLRTVHISDISAWLKVNFEGQHANPLSFAHHLYLNEKEISKLVIPNGTDKIGAYAFDGCESLSSVVIPNTVKTIGENAFRNCTDLGSVTCLIKTPFKIDESIFCCDGDYIYDTVYMLATLFVPRGRDNFYAQLDGWKKFSSIQTTETQFTISYILDGEPYKEYEVQATDVVTPEPSPTKEGYIFSGWSDIPWYMPAENVTVYGHFTIDPDYETGVENIISTGSTENTYYTADGRKLSNPQKGINIIRISDGTIRKVLIR